MVDTFFLGVVLGVMGFLVFVCLMYVASLWRISPEPDDPNGEPDPSGLVRLAASFQSKTNNGQSMNFEDALLLAVRVRSGLTGGILGLAGLLVVCGTVIICWAIRK